VYKFPDTSPHVRRRAAPVMGLVPTFPVTADSYTSVIPVLARITKVPAVPRFTGGGPLALALPHATSSNAVDHIKRLVIVLNPLFSL
jgi:hypothetical protein